MGKRSSKKKATRDRIAPAAPDSEAAPPKSISRNSYSIAWVPLLLAAAAFFTYWPSLKSGFVYDTRIVILQEGFITSLSNLPAVLSLKVLGMKLLLADRPGQILYLMLVASLSGKDPWGYHLGSNLLHAANVALLFVLLLRLIAQEKTDLARIESWKARLSAAVVTLIFALHPLTVEPVANVSYSSDLLVVFFTLLALLAATAFDPGNFRVAMITGTLGTICAFAAVTCKESGILAAFILIVYCFLFRRAEVGRPWFCFLGVAMLVTIFFLAACCLFAPPSPYHLSYLGGSFSQVFLVQPRLWVFMMGKLLWPAQLSADYTLENMGGLGTPLALAILIIVVSLQAWLTMKSRLGGLGVAVYWLGLATVSNFIPLYRILGDRFYYLPLAGVAMQLLALLLLAQKWPIGFWLMTAPCLGVIVPLAALNLTRQDVFADDFSLWSDTLEVSPFSSTAHYNFGLALFQKSQVDDAITHFRKALEINPDYAEAENNLGLALERKGQADEAIAHYQKALATNPDFAEAHNNLGAALAAKGELDDAIAHYEKALALNPDYTEAHFNLAQVLVRKGQMDDAIAHYQKALVINPNIAQIHASLGDALLQKQEVNEAIGQFQQALQLDPGLVDAQQSLAKAQALLQQPSGAK